MKAGKLITGIVAGSVTGVALGYLMLPRRQKKFLMRQGTKFWSKGQGLIRKTKFWQ